MAKAFRKRKQSFLNQNLILKAKLMTKTQLKLASVWRRFLIILTVFLVLFKKRNGMDNEIFLSKSGSVYLLESSVTRIKESNFSCLHFRNHVGHNRVHAA